MASTQPGITPTQRIPRILRPKLDVPPPRIGCRQLAMPGFEGRIVREALNSGLDVLGGWEDMRRLTHSLPPSGIKLNRSLRCFFANVEVVFSTARANPSG
jgi:hypothetical protein